VEEEEEEDEDDERRGEDDDEDAATGFGSDGTGLASDPGGAIGLTDSAILGAGGIAANPGVEFVDVPLDQEPDLAVESLEALAKAVSQAKTLRANPCLIDRGERALKRLKAWAVLRRAIEDLHSQRPAITRAAAAPVRRAVNEAREVGVSPRRLELGLAAARLGEQEVAMGQLRRMCESITVATHAVDGDIARLRNCVEDVRGADPDNAGLAGAVALLTRLEAEVGLGDSAYALEAALGEAEKVAVVHAEEDPTVYELPPVPEPTPEELAAQEAAAKAAQEAAKKGGGKGKAATGGGKGKAGAKGKKGEEEEEEEPLPPLYPSPQLRCVWRVDDLSKELEEVIADAGDCGADDALLERTRSRKGEVLARREELWEQEIARIRVFEAERIKREKKKKKGKKGKKKKK